MRYTDIQVGDTLKLAPGRAQAYAMQHTQILVTALQPRPGYKVGFIVTDTPAGSVGYGPNKDKWFFRATDFSRKL